MKIKTKQDLKKFSNAVAILPEKDGLQTKIVTRHFDVINPQDICDYFGVGGYCALEKCLSSYSSQQVIDIVSESGLRGRGGGGFLTGKKWQLASQNQSNQKWIVCNCDEGDPGAFMDRAIIEKNPHAIIEGMAIAAYATGANMGVCYVRAEYPLAASRMKSAIKAARECGILGKNIFGSSFCFDIEVVLGAGAFVCGEETALIASCHGRRGEPSQKPPYPAQSGLFNQPTVINNVETLAAVAPIIENGAKWFKSFGTKTSAGTKVFALSGCVKNAGLFEVEMGTSIKTLVEKIGGAQDVKAVQLGGPSGGCLPWHLCDVEIDYESLLAHGAMMGSGGIIVLSKSTCMVDMTKFFLQFSCNESCGKCTPCRIGNARMLEIVQKICDGKARMADLDKLKGLCQYIKTSSLCGLGQTSPNPVLAALKYFEDEFLEHILNHNCPAKVCKALVNYKITQKCIACGACKRICPTNAIDGETKKPPFVICDEKCIRCGSCKKICPISAITN